MFHGLVEITILKIIQKKTLTFKINKYIISQIIYSKHIKKIKTKILLLFKNLQYKKMVYLEIK
jgi:hypothetical protein